MSSAPAGGRVDDVYGIGAFGEFAMPIVLDLNGNGVDVSFGTKAAFDYDGDGFREQTAWAAPEDGFLVIDLNADGTRGAGDGVIDQGKEIAFAQWGTEGMTDLQALAEARDAEGNLIFDTNGDGVLDANDTSWSEMKVWQDFDQDGVTDEGELQTLESLGISRINLTYDDGTAFSDKSNDVTVLGNTLSGLASFIRNGKVIEGGVGDVSLAYNTYGWRQVETADGYRIEFESGEALAFGDAAKSASADIDLTAAGYVGAYGDGRDNVLSAAGSEGDVVITGGAGNDTITGGAGSDLIQGGAGADTIDAGAGNDVVFADGADDIAGGAVQGGEGYDQLNVSGTTGLNLTDLSSIGFESLEAGEGADTVGGQDDDVNYFLSGNGGNDRFSTAAGDDILIGGAGSDTLDSGAGNDRLFGGSGNDALNGGEGDDFLMGGAGDDVLNGGAGDDIYYYSRGDGADRINDYAEGVYLERYDYQEQVEYQYQEMVKRGSGKNAYWVNETRTGYRAEARQGYQEVYGEIDAGIDTLQFAAGIDLSDLLLRRAGNDMVIELRDAGNADLKAVGDSITITDWADQKNRIENFAFSDGTKLDFSRIMNGQSGMGGDDVLTGGDDGDFLSGGNGADRLTGNGGRDIISGGAGEDVIDGGAGKDFLYADAGDDTVRGGAGKDYLLGGAGNDTLEGGQDDDVLAGEDGNDTVEGGAGNDLILGGRGEDFLNGGAGDDTYIYFRGDGRDVIHDLATTQEEYQQATGRMVYQRSGKDGYWVEETRTAKRTVTVDGGRDTLQFGYSVALADLFLETTGNDLKVGIRDLNDPTIGLDLMDDVLTVRDWSNAMNRVETFEFVSGLKLDMTDITFARSGLEGEDNLNGTSGGDILSGGGGTDVLISGEGDDYLIGGAGNDRLDGGAGLDDLYGGEGDDTLLGGAGKDYLLGGAGDDTLEGGEGDDVLTGGRGDDLLKGGLGNDTYIFNRGDGNDTIDESAFDQITETYTYETGNRVLETRGRGKGEYTVWVNEVRTGTRTRSEAVEGGDDTLQFGEAIDISDLMINLTGDDLVVEIAPLTEGGVIEDSVTVRGWTTPEFRIETFRFANDFVLDMSGIDDAETGGDQADTIAASAGTPSWLAGAGGDDTLLGSEGRDILVGGTGSDVLRGGAGDDVYILSRGDGRDRISDSASSAVGSDQGNPGGDKILFGAGITFEDLILERDGNGMRVYIGDQNDQNTPLADLADSVLIENWADSSGRVEVFQFFNGLDFDVSGITNTYLGRDLSGPASPATVDDRLNGSSVSDWLDGFAGDDVLAGAAGDDFLFGRDGDDTLAGDGGDDILAGGNGSDALDSGAGNDILAAGAGDDVLDGGTGDDALMGGTGNDTIDGGGGNDVIVGAQGDDLIVASAGNDIIRFGFGDGADSYQGSSAADIRGTDTFVFEDDVARDDLWFEQVGNDLLVRLLGSQDTITFQNWYRSDVADAYVNGFATRDGFLSYADVDDLVAAMEGHVANDGSTAYGVTAGELPAEIATVIESVWTTA